MLDLHDLIRHPERYLVDGKPVLFARLELRTLDGTVFIHRYDYGLQEQRVKPASGVGESFTFTPDEDEQWAVDRGADLLEHYAEYIGRVKPEDIEAHPYLPELEQVAKDLRALSKRMSADGVAIPRGGQQ